MAYLTRASVTGLGDCSFCVSVCPFVCLNMESVVTNM